MPRKTCYVCGVMFVATRGDATTCSPRCRKIRSRFHQKHGRFPRKGECKEWAGLPHDRMFPEYTAEVVKGIFIDHTPKETVSDE